MDLLDGTMQLDKDAATQAVQKIADEFAQPVEEAANAIIQVANANMSDAVRLISVRRGYDPRDFALVAFGGAGPLHGAHLAKDLNIPNNYYSFSPRSSSSDGLFTSRCAT